VTGQHIDCRCFKKGNIVHSPLNVIDSVDNVLDFSSELMESLEVERLHMIHATFDDVGKRHSDGMCAIVGYAAYRDQWSAFNRAWMGVLKERGIDYLHTAEYLRSIPIIGGASPSDEDVAVILKPFSDVINQYITCQRDGFGVCIITDCAAYDSLSDADKKVIRKPELHSFEMAVGVVGYHVKEELHSNNFLALQIDETEDAPKLYNCYKFLKEKNDTLRSYLASICFVDDKKHPPIQAADMLGNLTLKAWRKWKRGEELHTAFKNLVFPGGERNLNVCCVVYDADRLKRVAQLRREGKIGTASIEPNSL
jgi:hypothetical protein